MVVNGLGPLGDDYDMPPTASGSTSSRLRPPAITSSLPSSSSSPAMSSYATATAPLVVQHQLYPDPPGQSYFDDSDEEAAYDLSAIDPDLRLRTTRTAHSVIAESVRSEALADKRKRRRLFSGLSRRNTRKVTPSAGSLRYSLRRNTQGNVHDESSGGAGDGSSSVAGDASTAGDRDHEPPTRTPEEVLDQVEESLPGQEKGGKKFKGKGKQRQPERRTVYVNLPLPPSKLTPAGEPIVRYVRNKVRTAKYTLVTFLPKNLFEQFYRAANVYFLALVILQVFSIFGATTPQIAMLPLVAILGMTAIKDAIEDWRRAKLDEEVNTSAATKLGGWKNVNQPTDARSFIQRMFNVGPAPGKPSKGVRKLREAEARAGKQIVLERTAKTQQDLDHDEEEMIASPPPTTLGVPQLSYQLDTIHSVAGSDAASDVGGGLGALGDLQRPRRLSLTSTAPSMRSRRTAGVVDWTHMASGTAQWERTLWKKLEVGDIVLLRDNEQIPADVIVLSTSDPDSLCFVETKNLDGETNLKPRKALKATSSIASEEDVEHARFVVDSEPPHANLYTYNGVLKYRTHPDKGEVAEDKNEAITINELLLRGCTLRNTKWVIGMVVFTGGDTKIMLNGGDTPSKRSKIEKETNFNVIMNFILLIVLCVATALLHGYYRSLSQTSYDYYEMGSEAANNIYLDSLIIFASSLIVFQNIVPVSLYITVEIVKTVQAYFISQDIEMYYEPFDTTCVPKSWNISDDLGQIEYVFSDKTGTLTQNVMEFKKCSIQGVVFGQGMTEAMLGAAKREGKNVEADDPAELAAAKETMVSYMKRAFKNRYLQPDKLTLIAPDLSAKLADRADPLRPHIIDFFRTLAICHTVLSDKPEPEEQPYVLDYKAESPDEAALVAAARDVGFPFVTRNQNRIDIEVLGQVERWTPLRVLEFNSTRKRMSVIVRNPEGQIMLLCKGADSVIYERLAADHDEDLKAATLKDLEMFANAGLRTLCIASRPLSDNEFFEWARAYDAASAATQDRDGEIDRACETIEHSLTILGATALEDKLQEGVPDAIAMLHKAGIKLWILTGDKLQTAIEIGYSCNLLTNDMEVMIINADTEDGARAQIEAGLNKIASVVGPPPTKGSRKILKPEMAPESTFAVVINGDSLRFALQPSLKSLFLSLGTQCAAVICCRVSPSQKALTVKMVKEGCNAMTLSIGDGANDVAMIQEANVGVGLFGLEGSQAAMSADYAFGQFRFLTRLLLVHGRWSYVRIADMHANFFYKNVIWTVSMFWFLIFNSFDATYLFDYTFILLFNLAFTSLPVGILGAFDQDTNAVASLAFPHLYKRGILGLDYTRTRFWLYMLDGLWQSLVIFFVPYFVYGDGTAWSSTGRDSNGLYDFSSTIACAGVFAANFYVGINTRYWTVITAVVLSLSTLLVFIWIPIYSALASLEYSGVVGAIYTTFDFWAIVLITVFVAVAPRFVVSAARQSYNPRDKDIVREAWVGGDLKDQLGVRHRKKSKQLRASRKGSADIDLSENMPHSLGDVDEEFGHDVEGGNMLSSTFTARLQKQLGASGGVSQDERGLYQPTAMQSPHRHGAMTPGSMSDRTNNNMSPSGYPSAHASLLVDMPSPTPQGVSSFPAPLQLGGTVGSNSSRGKMSPGAGAVATFAHDHPDSQDQPPPSATLSYISPSAIAGFDTELDHHNHPGLVPPPRMPMLRHTSSAEPLMGDTSQQGVYTSQSHPLSDPTDTDTDHNDVFMHPSRTVASPARQNTAPTAGMNTATSSGLHDPARPQSMHYDFSRPPTINFDSDTQGFAGFGTGHWGDEGHGQSGGGSGYAL